MSSADPPLRAVVATVADWSTVRSVYQPIVDLDAESIVGVEALARWPSIGPVNPEEVFAAARRRDALVDVEWASRIAAARGALAASLNPRTMLFVNIEPGLGRSGWPLPDWALAVLREARSTLRLVLEITERALLADPAALLGTIEWARKHHCGIAVDDVGSNPDTTALLPFIDPDFVKLDRSLIQGTLSPTAEQVREIVLDHVERSGAVIIAEGIENADHRERALSFGARLGQGWLYGHPARLSGEGFDRPESIDPTPFRPGTTALDAPSGLLAGESTRTGGLSDIETMCRDIEERALASHASPLTVLASFPADRRRDPAVDKRYSAIAEMHPFVASMDLAALRGSVRDEWTVVLVGPCAAVALIAREVTREGDAERTFEFVLTRDRATAVAAGRSLIRNMRPVPAATCLRG